MRGHGGQRILIDIKKGSVISYHSITGDYENKSIMDIEIPTFRPDIVGEADIVEEIMRIHGFDNIPVNSVSIYKEIGEHNDFLQNYNNSKLNFLYKFVRA